VEKSPHPVIKELLPGHAAELMRLRHAALREAPTAFGTDPGWELQKPEAYYRRWLLRIATRRRECLLGLWVDNQLIGMNGLGMRRSGEQTYALIYSMFVLPKYRGQGLGTALITHSCLRAREDWHADRLRITVEIGNTRAWKLYKEQGFSWLFCETAAFTLNGIDYNVDHMEKTILTP
jgi:ribosomal protein S18 acetylase RimI-like enzyme